MTEFLGVLGGMGPLATAVFLQKLVEHTPALTDQQHIPVLLYGDCTIPDRTASIVSKGESPLPKLLQGIRLLNHAGVKAICIPCNSAHYWFDEMAAESRAPLLHIVDATARQVLKINPRARSVGVLSTQGTHRAGMYEKTLNRMGFAVVAPTPEEFDGLVSPAIEHVKASRLPDAERLLREAAVNLVRRGAEIIILGCTEIPIGLRRQHQENPGLFVDSSDALAMSVVDFYASGWTPAK